MVVLASLYPLALPFNSINSSSSSSSTKCFPLTRRNSIFFATSFLGSLLCPSIQFAKAAEEDELQQQEERMVQVFQESSPSVVFIKDIERVKNPKSASKVGLSEDENVKVEGTGSGFIWDKTGHIVKNFVEDIQ